MLPDFQIMAQHTTLGEILAIGVSGHYCGNLALPRGGKEGGKVTVSRWLKSWCSQEGLGTVTTGKRDFHNLYMALQKYVS